MEYILSNFTVIQPTVIVVYGDPLAKCFMNRFSEGVVKVRLPAEYERKVVDLIVSVIHKHFYVIEDSGVQVLRLINGEKKGLPLFFEEV